LENYWRGQFAGQLAGLSVGKVFKMGSFKCAKDYERVLVRPKSRGAVSSSKLRKRFDNIRYSNIHWTLKTKSLQWSTITKDNSIRFLIHATSYLKIPRLQSAEHAFRIILPLNPPQPLPILLSIPRKHILTNVRVILIDIRRFWHKVMRISAALLPALHGLCDGRLA
jgi:hypothetical protein